MIELKASSYKGQQIIKRASRYEGCALSEVYDKYSADKQKAYDWCIDNYLSTENHEKFSICSYNTFGFTCSWFGIKDGEDILRYETKDNSYLVWLNR